MGGVVKDTAVKENSVSFALVELADQGTTKNTDSFIPVLINFDSAGPGFCYYGVGYLHFMYPG